MIFLRVPYSEKDAAKALGARWDALARSWYCPDGADLALFKRWLPTDLKKWYTKADAKKKVPDQTASSGTQSGWKDPWAAVAEKRWQIISSQGERFETEDSSGYLYQGKKYYDHIKGPTITGENYAGPIEPPAQTPLELGEVESIPVKGGDEFEVGTVFFAELERRYPGVDARQTLRRIRGWFFENTTRCKSRRNMKRFIRKWFAKEKPNFPRVQSDTTTESRAAQTGIACASREA